MLPKAPRCDRFPIFKGAKVRQGMRRSPASAQISSLHANQLLSSRKTGICSERNTTPTTTLSLNAQHCRYSLQRRNFHFQQNLHNAGDIVNHLKRLNYERKYEEAKKLFESGSYQTNEQAVEAYNEALNNLQAGNNSTSSASFSTNSEAPEAMNSNQSSNSNYQNNATQDYSHQWYQYQYQYYITQAQLQTRMLELLQKPIPVELASQRGAWGRIAAGATVGAIVVGILAAWGFSSTGGSSKDTDEDEKISGGGSQGGRGEFPMSPVHSVVKNVTERFDDVKGIDEAKEEVQEIVDYLKNPEKYTKLGAKLPKGVLLMGEPGTGKTLLARAIAGEAGVPFFYASGSAFDELYVGVGPKRVRMMFEDAKKVNGPCIIFIDEIDAMGTSRQRILSSSYARESTLNQLLTEMDGFKQNKGIIVIGATNFPDILDEALVRAGRFDKQVTVNRPDKQGRKEIVDLYLKKTISSKDVDSDIIAKGTVGFTGADLSNLVNLAAIKASRQNKKAIDMKDIEDARDDVIMGIKRSRGIESPEERKQTAYHEAGHALVGHYTPGCNPVHKITVVPRGHALGLTVSLPEKDEVTFTRKQILGRIAMAMGGRAAEEMIYGEDGVSSGASSDFRAATHWAQQMVTLLGMSPRVGFVSLQNRGTNKHDTKWELSDEQKRIVDDEVKRILENQYQHARNVLKEHEAELHSVATRLVENETLSQEDFKLIIQETRANGGQTQSGGKAHSV